MKLLYFCLFCLLSCLPAQAHKYYVSVTNFYYDSSQRQVKIGLKIFFDDLENAIARTGDKKIRVCQGKPGKEKEVLKSIEKYVKEHLFVRIDQKEIPWRLESKKCDSESAFLYLKAIESDRPEQVEIRNDILMEVFPEQRNIVQFNVEGTLQSTLLSRGRESVLRSF